MEKYIYDNSNSLWYELYGNYYLPCLVIPEEEIHTIGIWGRKHQHYLRQHRSMVYTVLVLSGKLYSYLAEIDTQVRNKLDLLVIQLAEKEGINDQLKEQNQLAWVRAMNNIRNRAEEIILKELIFAEQTTS
ncbi:MAG: TnpV protein [Clostridium sp.]|nr:TnpV protein [Clostridium sp.]MBS6913180.1 TnpV protein [Clostridium sp.]